APPPGWLDVIHGYQAAFLVPTVSEDVAREALVKFAESKWRYSAKPARNLTFKDLKAITVYRYRLETYTETRTSAWQFEPYHGQAVDGPQFGVSPPPWDIPVSLPQRFSDMVVKVRVPHSSFVKVLLKATNKDLGISNCHTCHGCGRTRCRACFGRGMSLDVCLQVYPIQGFPDQEICDVSQKLISEHFNRFSSTSRILQQRQTIEMVPLTHAHYTYSGKDFDFFVYGVENKVHAAKYPSACTIL
uniref:Uncharacterized protein n=1 Tax=Periophthalmus magnuspinnatus TaxID=409849 RepID=A0A3B3ZA20_9GOBI